MIRSMMSATGMCQRRQVCHEGSGHCVALCGSGGSFVELNGA